MNGLGAIISILIRRLAYFLAAAFVAFALASAFSTISVIRHLADMGVELTFGQQFMMILQDIAGTSAMFFPMVAFGFLVAFMASALICRYLRNHRQWLYALAGAAAMLTLHQMLKMAFGIIPIAGARTTGGLALQALAGALGALQYYHLRQRPEPAAGPGMEVD